MSNSNATRKTFLLTPLGDKLTTVREELLYPQKKRALGDLFQNQDYDQFLDTMKALESEDVYATIVARGLTKDLRKHAANPKPTTELCWAENNDDFLIRLQREVADLKGTLTNETSDRKLLEERLETTQKELCLLQERFEHTQKEHGSLQERFEHTQKEHGSLQERFEHTQKEHGLLQTRLNEHGLVLTKERTVREALQRQLDTLQETMLSLQRDLVQSGKTVGSIFQEAQQKIGECVTSHSTTQGHKDTGNVETTAPVASTSRGSVGEESAASTSNRHDDDDNEPEEGAPGSNESATTTAKRKKRRLNNQ